MLARRRLFFPTISSPILPIDLQVAAEGLSTFAEVNAARVKDAIGPAPFLRSLTPPSPRLTSRAKTRRHPHRHLHGLREGASGNDWDFMEDSDDENAANAGGNEDEDEMNHLDHYIALLRDRGAAALRRADGNLRERRTCADSPPELPRRASC